ncbi:hypothetical protein ABFY54_28790 [Priestia megaterium]|uniref:hypothetical protein n=1 Tax=Priestia megaterium TaxID=1404 RepID=UPI003D2704AC
MSNRLVKCYGTCEQKHYQSEMQKISGKNYCPQCYLVRAKEQQDREDLTNLIKELYNIPYPTGYMLKQIKQFTEERGYKYQGIAATLRYVFEIKRAARPEQRFGLSIVPHYYDEAREYYANLTKKRNETVIEKPQIKVLKMQAPVYQNNYREKKLINMEELLK